MILSDRELTTMWNHFFPKDLNPERDPSLINPASIDIRIGDTAQIERMGRNCGFTSVDLSSTSESSPYPVRPGQFMLVSTLEHLVVPNGYAVELKLKSSRARQGWNHSLAFWFDPGWSGIGTMEIQNITERQDLDLYRGLRFGQIIVHRLSSDAMFPYQGRYQHATAVESAKSEPKA